MLGPAHHQAHDGDAPGARDRHRVRRRAAAGRHRRGARAADRSRHPGARRVAHHRAGGHRGPAARGAPTAPAPAGMAAATASAPTTRSRRPRGRRRVDVDAEPRAFRAASPPTGTTSRARSPILARVRARAPLTSDRVAEWVGELLASPGSDNAILAAALAQREHWWWGPVRVPVDDLVRLAGPEDDVLVPDRRHRVGGRRRLDGGEPRGGLGAAAAARRVAATATCCSRTATTATRRWCATAPNEVWVFVYSDDPRAQEEFDLARPRQGVGESAAPPSGGG